MKENHIVVINRPEHSGYYYGNVDDHEWWSNSNQNGLRVADISGSHGTLVYFNSEKEARDWLANYLKCDSVEKGTYCYSHNKQRG